VLDRRRQCSTKNPFDGEDHDPTGEPAAMLVEDVRGSGSVDVYAFAERHATSIADGDWDAYERAGIDVALSLAAGRHVQGAAGVDLARYTSGVQRAISHARARADVLVPSALYFEYDLDNRWESNIFFCSSFEPSFVPFAEWPIGSDEHIEGPDLPAFAKAYARLGWSDTAEARAIVILTVARTTAAFGRALQVADPGGSLPWGIGFHDQDPITTVTDPTRRRLHRSALREGLERLGTPAAIAAIALLPDEVTDASMCVVRRMRWSWKFLTCRRLGWTSLGGSELMAGLPDEVRREVTGWRVGGRTIVAMGASAARPDHCVILDEVQDRPAPDGAAFDDLDALAAPADTAYRNALRSHGIDPHR
jgi:hypothetical protein